MIVLVLRNFGGSWEQWEDDLTATRLQAMVLHLKEFPPTYQVLMSGLGVKVDASAHQADRFRGNDAVMALMQSLPKGELRG